MSRAAQHQSGTRVDSYLADFERSESQAASDPAWLREARRRGIDLFAEAGFPTTADEEWKFTSVAPIASRAFAPGASTLDITAGRLPAGARVTTLRSVLADTPAALQPYLGRLATPDKQAFTALNTAFAADGAFIWLPPGVVVEDPIAIRFTAPTGDIVAHPRVLIVAGDNSQVRVVEQYEGPEGQEYFTNAVTEVIVGAGAVVDHYKVQREAHGAFHVASMYVHTTRDSNFSSHSIAFGGGLVRNDVFAVLDGEGGECTLNGLYLSDGRRLVDNHTTIDHAKPHCGSHEVYKGILGGHARAVFNGKIVVRPDAQKTDAKQTNRALLLTNDAQINTKPQLEIFANDVKCTHGAAVGQLDEDAMFYLRARGLDLQQARAMLIHAFAGDVLNRIKIESLRQELDDQLLAELPDAEPHR